MIFALQCFCLGWLKFDLCGFVWLERSQGESCGQEYSHNGSIFDNIVLICCFENNLSAPESSGSDEGLVGVKIRNNYSHGQSTIDCASSAAVEAGPILQCGSVLTLNQYQKFL